MEQNRAVVVLVLLIIFFFPDTSTPPDHRARIAREHDRLDVLRNSTFGHPGNTTGLLSLSTPPEVVRAKWRRMREALLAQYLLPVPSLGAELFGTATNITAITAAHNRNDNDRGGLRLSSDLPVYHNVTGNVLGDWTKLRFDQPLPTTGADNTTSYTPNLTKLSGGKLTLDLEDASDAASQGHPVMRLKMVLRLKDADGKIEAVANLFGIHFTATGEMVAATTSDRFATVPPPRSEPLLGAGSSRARSEQIYRILCGAALHRVRGPVQRVQDCTAGVDREGGRDDGEDPHAGRSPVDLDRRPVAAVVVVAAKV